MTLVFTSQRTAGATPGRPAGEVRSVIVSTLRESGPLAQRDLARHAQIGVQAVRRTVDNMVRCGALVVAGQEKRDHSRKWVALYDLAQHSADDGARQSHGWEDLARCVQSWAR